MGFHEYAGSREELTPLDTNVVWKFLCLTVIFFGLLIGGSFVAEKLTGDTVKNYSLSPKGWKKILEKVDADKGKVGS